MVRCSAAVVVACAAALASRAAAAQTPPWHASPPRPGEDPPPEAPRAARWPDLSARQRVRPALPPAFRPGAPPSRETPDPGAGAYFQLPTARLLRYGDVLGQYVGALGWAGVRYGVTRNIDVGAGVPYYFAGLSVDARVSFARGAHLAAAWWAYATVPFLARGERPASSLGFTWAWAGVGWATGPLVTLWGERVAVNAGLHVAQRAGLGGVWLLGHATLDVKLTDGVKALAQAVVLYEASPERMERASALLGNGPARVLPYALAGVRLYTRRFSADLGVLIPLAADIPLHSERLPVIPWLSLSHLF